MKPAKLISKPWFLSGTACLCILLTFIGQSFVAHNQYNDSDSSYFVYGAQYILNGGTLYQGFWDQKPPGIFWTNAFLIKCFGLDFTHFAIFGGFCFLLFLVFIYIVLRPILNLGYLCLSILLFTLAFNLNNYLDYGNRPEFYLSLFDGLAMLCALRFVYQKQNLYLFACGFFAACAAFYKPVGLATFLAISAWLILFWRRDHLKAFVVLSLGLSCPLIIGSLILFAQGSLYESIQATLLIPLQLSASNQSLWEAFSWMVICYGPIWGSLWLLLLTPILLLSKEITKEDRSLFILLLLWLFASLSGVVIQRNGEPHYFLQGVAPIVFCSIFILSRLCPHPFLKQKRNLLFVVFLITFAIFIQWHVKRQVQRWKQLDTHLASEKEVLELSAWLEQHLKKDESFYYFSNGYQPYIWTEFKPPHRYSSYFMRHGNLGASMFLDNLNTFKDKAHIQVIVEHIRTHSVLSSEENLNSEAKRDAYHTYHQWKQQSFQQVAWPSKRYRIYRRKAPNS